MRRILVLAACLWSASLGAQDLELDLLTGYATGIEEIWQIHYGDFDDFEPDTEAGDAGPASYDIVHSVLDEMEKIDDDLFDFPLIASKVRELFDANGFMLKTDTDRDITHVALTSSDCDDNLTLYLSRYFLEQPELTTLVFSSIAREIKAIYDYAFGSRSGFIRADKLESYLFVMDSYYLQARFIDHLFISNQYRTTRFEWFLYKDYSENLLLSFSNYFLGIDRDFLVGADVILHEFLDGEIPIDGYMEKLRKHFEIYLNDKSYMDYEEGFHYAICHVTAHSFLPYFTDHRKVSASIGSGEEIDRFREGLSELIDKDVLGRNGIRTGVMDYRLSPEMIE